MDSYPPPTPRTKAQTSSSRAVSGMVTYARSPEGSGTRHGLRNRAQKYQKTRETTAYLERNHHVVEIWECEFRQFCRQNPQIYDFIDARRPGFFREHKGKITENTVLEGVLTGGLFGMVEVDILVPDQWTSHFRHPSLSPYDYFREMSPLFCTTDIAFDDIREHMQAHIWKYHLSDRSRRLLVGGMKARQILLATPLLQWYLQHGLVVTKIYQVVEFQQQHCFREFVKELSDARRQGDDDPDTGIIADTMKVIGNSSYGSLIMDKTKHSDVKYVQGENQTCLKINDPLFRNLDASTRKSRSMRWKWLSVRSGWICPSNSAISYCSTLSLGCCSFTMILWTL